MREQSTKKIVFVCTGNTCRSPMAEAICRSELKRWGITDVEVLSAGTSVAKGDGLNKNSAITLAENGLSLENFSSKLLTDEILDEAYAVVCMTEHQRQLIDEKRAFDFFSSGGSRGSMEENVYSFYTLADCEIPDPYGRELECYRLVFKKLEECMPTVLKKLGFEKKELPVVTEEKEKPTPKKRGRPRKTVDAENKENK